MSGNNLLLWMSARGTGSLQQFRSAIERLRVEPEEDLMADGTPSGSGWGFESTGRLSPYTLLRLDFHSLSHVEFFEQNWKVTPSTIAVTNHGDVYRCVLNGGRSPNLLEALSRTNPDIEISIADNAGNPDTIIVSARILDPVKEFAAGNGIHVQQDAAAKLLVSYGHQLGNANLREDPLPIGPGWQITRFSVQNLEQHWLDSSEENVKMTRRASLFRYKSDDQTLYFLSRSGKTFSINQQDGKYIVLQNLLRRPLFQYDPDTQNLFIPGWCRPPLLVDRALILCSGTVPKYDRFTGRLAYAMVPPPLAKLTANVVRQRLTT